MIRPPAPLLWLVALLAAAAPARAELGNRTVREKKLYDNVYAVCIGVDAQLRDDLIPTLRFAGNDARAVHEIFQQRYGYDSELIVGPQATRDTILKKIKFAAAGAAEHDVLIVYFAGHGQTVTPPAAAPHEKAGYLIAYDTDLDFTQPITDLQTVENQAVSMTQVVKLVSDSKAAHVLLILDCCFSGFAADVDLASRSITPGEKQALADLLSDPTRQVFTAGTDQQKSLEDGKLQHGLFTYHLIEELKTTPHDIYSLVEAFAAVRGKVSAEAAKRNGRMTPQLRHLRPSNGDWVFIDKTVAADALTQYESRSQPKTSEQEYDTHTASARSVTQEKGSLENDPSYVAQHQEYERRAATGDSVAMAALQYDYEHGVGVKKDPAMAFFWADQASKFDASPGRVGKKSLAHSYRAGVGVEPNAALADNLDAAINQALGQVISKGLGGESMTQQEQNDAIGSIVSSLGDLFDAGGKASHLRRYRVELAAAADSAKADKVDEKLTKLEKALDDLQAKSRNGDGKLDPAFAARLADLHARMAPHVQAARKWESVGVFHKIEPELKQMDDAIGTLEQLMPK